MSLQEDKRPGTVTDVSQESRNSVLSAGPHVEGCSGKGSISSSISRAGQRREAPEAGPGKGGRLPGRERAELASSARFRTLQRLLFPQNNRGARKSGTLSVFCVLTGPLKTLRQVSSDRCGNIGENAMGRCSREGF